MSSAEMFAKEEARLGRHVHFHDGVWWGQSAPFYCKPVHEFRPFPPRSARPHPLQAWMGYSHQVPEAAQATRTLRWNAIQGDELRSFSLQRLRSNRRNKVRAGLRDCRVEVVDEQEVLLEEMRAMNVSQAKRFDGMRDPGSYLPAEYYERHAEKWRGDMRNLFRHSGHRFVGAFVGDRLAAYVDLIQIEDTWMFGAVKSHADYLSHRPVDALYFTVLDMASKSGECARVLNGGGDSELESLARFKAEYYLLPVDVPYYSQTLLPMARLRRLKTRLAFRRSKNDGAGTTAGAAASSEPS